MLLLFPVLFRLKQAVRESPVGPFISRTKALLSGKRYRALWRANYRHDQQTIAVMKAILKPNSSCIDVGAHSGEVLRSMIKIAPKGRHIAFEPIPYLADFLRSHYPQVSVHQCAVSDHVGIADFVLVENALQYSGLRKRLYDRPDPVFQNLSVHLVRLDDVIPNELPVAFIKLDIEGGEFHALCGAAALIRRCHPVIVFEAEQRSTGQYGVSPEDIFCFVEALAYRLSTMDRWLRGLKPYERFEFSDNWHNGPENYFIAYP